MKAIYPFRSYIVFDFETTGFDAQKDEVIQMSAICIAGETIKDKFNRFVKIKQDLPEKITQLTGISKEKLEKDGISKDAAWKQFKDFIGEFALVGHNVIKFDRLFLEKNFEDFKFEAPNKHRYIDTAMLFKAIKMEARPMWYENHYQFASRISEQKVFGLKFNLSQCCKDLKIDVSHLTAHQSDSDIEMTWLIYKKFLEDIK